MPLPQLKTLDVGSSMLRAYQLKSMKDEGSLRKLKAGNLIKERGYLEEKREGEKRKEETVRSKEVYDFMEEAVPILENLPEDQKEDGYAAIIANGVNRFNLTDNDIQGLNIPRSYRKGGKEWAETMIKIGRAEQDPKHPAFKALADLRGMDKSDPMYSKAQAKVSDLFKPETKPYQPQTREEAVGFAKDKWKPDKAVAQIKAEKRAGLEVAAEFDKGETPKTAMAAFLANNSDATADEIATYAQKLKGKGMSMTMPDGTVVQVGGPQESMAKILQKETENVRELESTTEDIIATSTNILNDLNADATLIGATGWIQRTVDSLGSQVEGIANKIAPKLNIDVSKVKPEKFDWKEFSGDAVKSAAIKSRVIKLAYAIARLREPNARQFSDADIQRAIDEIGAATGSPNQMAGVMKNIQMDSIKALDRRYQKTMGKQYVPKGLTPETLDYGVSKGIQREEIILRHLIKYGQ